MAESHRTAGDNQFSRIRRILNFGVDAQQREHLIHVHQRLLDLAINHAQKIQRNIKLDQQRIDQHQIAQGQRARRDTARRAVHQQGQAAGNQQTLGDVEPRQRRGAAHRRCFPALQIFVVALDLEFFVAEIFDRLVVKQAIDGLGAGARIHLVHRTAKFRAPLGDDDGRDDVDDQCAERDNSEPNVVFRHHDDADQRHLQQRRQNAEDSEAQQRLDAARAALDVARHAAGLAFQVKA